ncbi:MAG: hypothetical protein KAV41_03060 [Candidatus Pacebacteria bacterium]|nr:hypothetical protein [Candidatus Paceibacterota bacterium]
MSENVKKVVAVMGEIFEVDISDEACLQFGFRHGDRMVYPGLGKGVVEGVAPATGEGNPQPDVLWYALDFRDGKVSYSPSRNIVQT